MRAQAIARIVNEDVQKVRQTILELIHDYEKRESGLEIADDNGYIIQVKDQYSSIIDEFVPMEMPIALVRTLSAIAIKQPVAQSEIIKIRGAGAYDHIKELVEKELIVKREDGRSPLLSTTKRFQEYFRLSHDAKSLRQELRKEEKTSEAEGDDDASASGQLSLELPREEAMAGEASQPGDVSTDPVRKLPAEQADGEFDASPESYPPINIAGAADAVQEASVQIQDGLPDTATDTAAGAGDDDSDDREMPFSGSTISLDEMTNQS